MTAESTSRAPRSWLRLIVNGCRLGLVGVIAFGGYTATAGFGGESPAGESSTPFPDFGKLTEIITTVPKWLQATGFDNGKLWLWSGASPGEVRTVTIDIDPSATPVDGVTWTVNGQYDRFDRYGPLDEPDGLWHASTQRLHAGDVVMACWTTADGDQHCPEITVRP